MSGKQRSAITLIMIITLSLQVSLCSKQEKQTGKSNVTRQKRLTSKHSTGNQSATVPTEEAVELVKSLDDLNSIVEGTPGQLLVFDLYADWCHPCKLLAPTFSALANDHRNAALFYRVDVQKNPDIASAFRVRGIPYVVFIKDKQIVHTLQGLNPREHYEKVITTCDSTVSAEECRTKMQQLL